MTPGPPTDETGDEALAERAARPRSPATALAGAQQAFAILYLRYARRLLAFLSRWAARHELDDIHQGVWARVWERLPQGFQGGHFRGWLFRVARNHLIDLGRRPRPERLEDAASRPDERAPDPLAVLQEAEDEAARRQRLADCLRQLPAEEANVVRGRLGGESYQELSGRLGVPAARLHKLYHQAAARLQTCVGR